jgi:hypothetical protein
LAIPKPLSTISFASCLVTSHPLNITCQACHEGIATFNRNYPVWWDVHLNWHQLSTFVGICYPVRNSDIRSTWDQSPTPNFPFIFANLRKYQLQVPVRAEEILLPHEIAQNFCFVSIRLALNLSETVHMFVGNSTWRITQPQLSESAASPTVNYIL